MSCDDDLSESGEIGVMGAIKANYIEKIVVSARLPETDDRHGPTHHPVKTVNLVPQLSRVPLFVENNRPATSAISAHPVVNHPSDTVPSSSDGKTKGKGSPPRPPTSSTPSRVGTSQRPKSSNRVVTAPASTNSQTQLSQSLPLQSSNSVITNVSPVKYANIENRILIRLANILPSETDTQGNHPPTSAFTHQHTSNDHGSHNNNNNNNNNSLQFSKLPESRNMLLRLNHDLDDVMTDIRNWGLELDRFNFGDMQTQDSTRNKDITAGSSLDNNPLVFDQVIAELSGQASRKVLRIKKMYRNQMQKLKKQYEKHVSELKGQADALSSRLFESRLQSDNLSEALHSAGGDPSIAPTENDALHQHQRLVKVLREEQDSMQEVLLRRLENERKMTLERFSQLDMQLKDSQAELKEAKEKIVELSAQLLERENTQLAKDREAVNDLTEQLKDLIKVSQTTVASK